MKPFKEYRFQDNPVKAYDPFYTKDINLFDCAYHDWRCDIKQRAERCITRRDFFPIMHEIIDVHEKIYTYERATGTHLLSFTDTAGRMSQDRRWMRLLDEILRL